MAGLPPADSGATDRTTHEEEPMGDVRTDDDNSGRGRRSRYPAIATIAVAATLSFALAAGHAPQTSTASAAYASGAGAAHDHAHAAGHNTSTSQREVAQVRSAVARYHTPARAEAAGWGLVEGLDHCFENPGVGAMGYHYIDEEQLGVPTLDPARPEALVFVPGPQGQLRLGAVEYVIPVDAWEHDEPPSVLGLDLHVLEPVPGLEVWGLHVWLFERNPAGMFADWNPRVGCDT